MKNISNFATWPGDCFNNNENYPSARVTCQNSCIFSPIMSESLYLDTCSLEILQNTILFVSVAIQSWPGDVFTITRIIYRHASRVKILVSCIFSPIMSTTVKDSLYLDLDSRYYRIL